MRPGDRELLELAAKAAGIGIHSWNFVGYAIVRDRDGRPIGWNALEDDGDALRLAVKLQLDISVGTDDVIAEAYRDRHDGSAKIEGDPFAATRLAIVRAAAAIQGAMP